MGRPFCARPEIRRFKFRRGGKGRKNPRISRGFAMLRSHRTISGWSAMRRNARAGRAGLEREPQCGKQNACICQYPHFTVPFHNVLSLRGRNGAPRDAGAATRTKRGEPAPAGQSVVLLASVSSFSTRLHAGFYPCLYYISCAGEVNSFSEKEALACDFFANWMGVSGKSPARFNSAQKQFLLRCGASQTIKECGGFAVLRNFGKPFVLLCAVSRSGCLFSLPS